MFADITELEPESGFSVQNVFQFYSINLQKDSSECIQQSISHLIHPFKVKKIFFLK